MSYVKENLIDGETIIYAVKIHWTAWLPGFFLLMIIDSLFFFAFLIDDGNFGVFTILPLLFFGVMTYSFYVIPRTRELALTNKRVISKEGWIRIKTSELKLSKLETIEIEQGVLERMFEAGSVVFRGTGGSETTIGGIDKPLEFRRKFLEYTDRNTE